MAAAIVNPLLAAEPFEEASSVDEGWMVADCHLGMYVHVYIGIRRATLARV